MLQCSFGSLLSTATTAFTILFSLLLHSPISLCADQSTLVDIAHRSPVDVVLAKDESWLVTANETSDSITLVDLVSGNCIDELKCGGQPASIVLCLNGQHLLVSCTGSGEILLVQIDQSKLLKKATISVGYEPVGLTVTPDGQTAFVGLTATGEVAQLNLQEARVEQKFAVGAWPRYLAISPDGTRLAIACSGDSKIVVADAIKGEVLYEERLIGGINIGHMQCSEDGKYVYFPWMVYRSNPITVGNIQRGWVLASRIGRVRLDGPAYREAISLDVPQMAIADPHGLAMSSDGNRLVVSASGTHELLIYRRPDLPFIGAGGPGDLIDSTLLRDRDIFSRVDVGGRPMGMAISADNKTVYVANYINDSVQKVDVESRKIVQEISLGRTPEKTLARHGMELFYDGQRSLDQWYSCHSCHYNSGVNSKAMDTMNDGSTLTMKTVLPLYHLQQTSPWTWHGWQSDLQDAMHTSFTTTMLGNSINDEEARAVMAYLNELQLPQNPFRNPDGSLTEAAVRGEKIFRSEQAACASCHNGPYFTDGKIHDVGLGSAEDYYNGYNTPTLIGLYRKVRYLHDGRSKSLEDVLTGDHAPEKVSGERALSPEELSDLVAYLKSL
ncbi:cytochrome c peroxidase [Rubinisphaera italica]|uniref:Lactonase, 7-bladed beta-propeller n=1 Tax=Rubinisphaera italica TaxID=2527969 RepID=A0A5C5XBW0_9PLAN|nr:cytochrome c peroxidase [Rubinisphaera italica]TWT59911.1 Lactonase, 7-bladed beta-propeller [Rubinisphaera italica]